MSNVDPRSHILEASRRNRQLQPPDPPPAGTQLSLASFHACSASRELPHTNGVYCVYAVPGGRMLCVFYRADNSPFVWDYTVVGDQLADMHAHIDLFRRILRAHVEKLVWSNPESYLAYHRFLPTPEDTPETRRIWRAHLTTLPDWHLTPALRRTRDMLPPLDTPCDPVPNIPEVVSPMPQYPYANL